MKNWDFNHKIVFLKLTLLLLNILQKDKLKMVNIIKSYNLSTLDYC